jgi:pimeloyl-ACP methyl ester carboxylesterase
MPYANNNGIKIFYKLEGKGPPIVLQHGLAGTHLDWIKFDNYVDSLKTKYQLILLDARGRGKSDKPYTPEMHSMKNYVGDITAILNDIGLEKAHFWGYSFGGRVGLAAVVYAPERFNSLIIGGVGMYEKDSPEFFDDIKEYIQEYESRIPVYGKSVEEVTAHIRKTRGNNMNDYTVERWMNADPRALIAYCSYIDARARRFFPPSRHLVCYMPEIWILFHINILKCVMR